MPSYYCKTTHFLKQNHWIHQAIRTNCNTAISHSHYIPAFIGFRFVRYSIMLCCSMNTYHWYCCMLISFSFFVPVCLSLYHSNNNIYSVLILFCTILLNDNRGQVQMYELIHRRRRLLFSNVVNKLMTYHYNSCVLRQIIYTVIIFACLSSHSWMCLKFCDDVLLLLPISLRFFFTSCHTIRYIGRCVTNIFNEPHTTILFLFFFVWWWFMLLSHMRLLRNIEHLYAHDCKKYFFFFF